ncbi:DUF1769-domain-containing protein [Testicularia cyperi]|uniref:DUF1769-domain-containing protein n=1 Tax=Testicularia cyperi TaxID=1882483 RepID=A0A317XF29_9BASI|nr:DUF1769-domain-containing protein [Testicularia cyperi]
MAPSLKISAGPSVDSLETVAVNHDETPVEIATPLFQGRIAVRIKNFTGRDPPGVTHRSDSEYFENGHGKGQSWSMQIQARFLDAVSADDLVFGNEFDRPIRDHLPYGIGVALQFVRVVDPNLEHDLYADRPHAWSPYIATMPRISSVAFEGDGDGDADGDKPDFSAWPAFPTAPDSYVEEDITSLIPSELADSEPSSIANLKGGPQGIPKANEYRLRFFSNPSHRQAVSFNKHHIVAADFFNGFIDFNDLSLHIPFAAGLKFDLKKYWDGQPVRYICKNRATDTTYFVIQFDIVDLDQ